MRLARPLENLIDQLLKLPTIGPKTAQRLALYILKMPVEDTRKLSRAITEAREKVFPCSGCGNLTDIDPCHICEDPDRDDTLLCVAEEASNIVALERTGFKGRYYVINRSFKSMEDKELARIDFQPLLHLLEKRGVEELILALNPDIDGEIMSRYIARILSRHKVKITRLAHGLPVGGDIEFADEITLRRAIEGRKELS